MSGPTPMHQFCWNELATTDVEAAKTFYGNCFGWTFSEHHMENGSYTMIKRGDREFAGMWHIPKEQAKDIPPHWMSYILVENLQDMLVTVAKHGAQIKVPTTKAGEFGLFAVIIDPTGAHIALWESHEDCPSS